MELNARVWAKAPDAHGGEWFRATVHAIERKDEDKNKKVFAKFHVVDDGNCSFDINTQAVGTSFVEYEFVKLQNEADAVAIDINDLTSLQNLHEPAILNALRERYLSDIIYTNTGPILIAINPYKRVNIYSAADIEMYNKSSTEDDTSPHVFKVANTAFKNLEASQFNGFQNQCILVSGESGAGKTETTKFIMRYLAEITKASDNDGEVKIEDRILQSNSILESFGNAKTLRNDNSSRFGKFIEISFTPSNGRLQICGSVIRTYLLEKVRLIQQNVGERNYHCFYEFLSGANEEQRAKYGLGDMEWSDFSYLMKSGTDARDDDVEDVDQYEQLNSAMSDLNFSGEELEGIYSILSAILHLGNITFSGTIGTGTGNEDGSVVSDESALHLQWCCRLLGFNEDEFSEVLCNKHLRTTDGILVKKLIVEEAEAARDAFSKAIYGTLFDFIVDKINKSIAVVASGNTASTRKVKGGRHHAAAPTIGNIGLLDIFGFESFDTNSFEQLCINYTNETLQQHFNQFVFTHEQALYEKEGIAWSFIQFPDNSEILKLLEDKKGIFSLCDDQVLFPQASDDTLVNKLYASCLAHPNFSADSKEKARGLFTITHYAGPVQYSSKGFVEKNRDTVRHDMVKIIEDSSLQLTRKLSSFMRSEGAKKDQPKTGNNISPVQVKRGGKSKICSLGAEFRQQLGDLIQGISKTAPHYIRCLKPNEYHESSNFTSNLIVHQLRYGGVLEAVRVTRAGFPNRYPFEEFYKRFGMLARPAGTTDAGTWREKVQPMLNRLVAYALSDPKEYTPCDDSIGHANDMIRAGAQCGKTQVFLRNRFFDFLEKHRLLTLRRAATHIKAVYRGRCLRRAFLKKKAATSTISRGFRCHVARRTLDNLRKAKAVQVLQCAVRGFIARCARSRLFKAVLSIQFSYVRYKIAKRVYVRKINRCSTKIVAFIKGCTQRKSFHALKHSTVAVQCLWRRRSSVKVVKALRAEMKSLKSVQGERDSLLAKLAAMQAEMERAKNEPPKVIEVIVAKPPLTPPPSNTEDDHGDSPDSVQSPMVQKLSPFKLLSPNAFAKTPLSISPAPDVSAILANINTLKSQLSSVEDKYRSSCETVYWLSHSVSELLNISVDDVTAKLELDGMHSDYEKYWQAAAAAQKPDHFTKLTFDFAHQPTKTEVEVQQIPVVTDVTDLSEVMSSIESGDAAALRVAVNKAPCLLKSTHQGLTPLHHVCMSNSIEMLDALFWFNADVNRACANGLTPLHVSNSIAVVELLLRDGANPNCMDSNGVTPLGRFVATGQVDCVKALLGANADPSMGKITDSLGNPIRYCVLKGDYTMLSLLASESKFPLDFKQRNEDGETLLHAALLSAQPVIPCIMFLLNKDPELLKSSDNNGTTPLHVLCSNSAIRSEDCFEPILDIMLMFGASPNAKDADGCTALVIAAAYRDWSSCEKLLLHGADMNIPCLMSSRSLRSDSDSWKRSDCGVQVPGTGSLECTASDLMTPSSRAKLFQFISTWQSRIPPHARDRCMNCATLFNSQDQAKKCKMSCLHCGRIVCGDCTSASDKKRNLSMPAFLGDAAVSDHQFCSTCCTTLSM